MKHLDYMVKIGSITHSGEKTLRERIKEEGDTGLHSGEIIGFSPTLNELFDAWLDSKSHRETILSPKWTKMGFATKVIDGTYLYLVNFSSGIIYNSSLNMDLSYSFNFLEEPIFKSRGILYEYRENDGKYIMELKTKENKIIQVYNSNNELTDIVEVFF